MPEKHFKIQFDRQADIADQSIYAHHAIGMNEEAITFNAAVRHDGEDEPRDKTAIVIPVAAVEYVFEEVTGVPEGTTPAVWTRGENDFTQLRDIISSQAEV